jgi:hypothetical protein
MNRDGLDNMAYVTDYARHRCRKRLGIPASASERMAAKAKAEGIPRTELSGGIRRYLDSRWVRHGRKNDIRVYGQDVFIFDDNRLVTAWPLPSRYRSYKKEQSA